MINLNIQLKLIIFSLIYGFLFSIVLDYFYSFLPKLKKYSKVILSFILIFLMTIIYFVGIKNIGHITFHFYSIIAIIIGFIGYDLLLKLIANINKKWYTNLGDNMSSRRVSKATKRRLTLFGTLSIISIIYFGVSLSYHIYTLYDLNKQKDELNEYYKKLKKEAEDLQIEIDRLKDPEYLARYAREKYYYSKEGEYIIKINDTEKDIETVDDELKTNYVILGLCGSIILIFVYIWIKAIKK